MYDAFQVVLGIGGSFDQGSCCCIMFLQLSTRRMWQLLWQRNYTSQRRAGSAHPQYSNTNYTHTEEKPTSEHPFGWLSFETCGLKLVAFTNTQGLQSGNVAHLKCQMNILDLFMRKCPQLGSWGRRQEPKPAVLSVSWIIQSIQEIPNTHFLFDVMLIY